MNTRLAKRITEWRQAEEQKLTQEYEAKQAEIQLVYSLVTERFEEGIDKMPCDPEGIRNDLRKVNQRLDNASKYHVLMEQYRKKGKA